MVSDKKYLKIEQPLLFFQTSCKYIKLGGKEMSRYGAYCAIISAHTDCRTRTSCAKGRGFESRPSGIKRLTNWPDAVADSVERRYPMQKIGGLSLNWFKPMAYKIDTCRYLAWHSALMECVKDWLAQCQENVPLWDIRSWWHWPGLLVGKW